MIQWIASDFNKLMFSKGIMLSHLVKRKESLEEAIFTTHRSQLIIQIKKQHYVTITTTRIQKFDSTELVKFLFYIIYITVYLLFLIVYKI